MRDIDYPWIYAAADHASGRGRKQHQSLLRLDIALTILAGVAGFAAGVEHRAFWLPVAAVLLVGAVFARLARASLRPHRSWFDGRAVAESSKTLTWRYMLRVEPFDGAEADTLLGTNLKQVIDSRSELELVAPTRAVTTTAWMRRVRETSWGERRDIYLTERLDHQINWYSSRAITGRTATRRWFAVGLGAQFVALALLVVQISADAPNLVPVLSAISTGATAWSQIGGDEPIARSYALASQELALLRERLAASDEASLPAVVRDCEASISREHTMWMAKRA